MEPRRTGITRVAIALVVVVLVIVGAIGLVEAGPRLRTSAASSSTTSTSLASSVATSREQSSSQPEPIQVLAPSVARLNPDTSLSLNLNLTANANRSITVMAYEVNTLSKPNNVTSASNWPVKSVSALCNPPGFLVGYTIYQGAYDAANYTQGTPLNLGGNMCMVLATPYTIFNPLSSEAILGPPTGPNNSPFNASASATFSGYILGGNGTQPFEAFVPFPPGIYTVAAVDEWGNIVTSQFRVTTTYTATTAVLTTLTQDVLACESGCIELYGWAFSYTNSTVLLDLGTVQNPGTTELNITFSGLPSNSGFTGSVNLSQVLLPQCSCPFAEQFIHSPVLPNLKQGDEVKVAITGTSGLSFSATFTI